MRNHRNGAAAPLSCADRRRAAVHHRIETEGAAAVFATLVDMEAMEYVKVYVGRGRRFADSPSNLLKSRWLAAFIEGGDRIDDNALELADINAELNIRGLEAPYESVAHLVDDKTAKRMTAESPEVAEHFEELLEKWIHGGH